MRYLHAFLLSAILVTAAKAAQTQAGQPWHSHPVSVKPLDLLRAPTADELMAAGQLGGPLFPTHEPRDKARDESGRRAFGQAIQQWNQHEYPKAVEMFRQFLKEHPDSPWAAEVELHIGCDASYNGRFTEAEMLFRKLIADHQGKDHAGAKMLMNKARQRLAILQVEHNQLEPATTEFSTLLQESPDWRHRTYASLWIQKLARFKAAKQALANCGAEALAYALEKQGRAAAADRVRTNLPATTRGHSLATLTTLSREHGLEMGAFELTAAQLHRLPLPAILQIHGASPDSSGHYWILDKLNGTRAELYDPQAVRRFSQTLDELAREWSGRVLVFSSGGAVPGRRLTLEEMEGSFGGCCGVPRKEDDLGDPQEPPPKPKDSCSEGFPRWSVNVVNMNLFVTDTPLWYNPPIGPEVRITLSYNAQSAIAQYEPFGSKWQFNYGSYLVVDTAGTVVLFMPNGRRDVYTPTGAGNYAPPYKVHNTLISVGSNRYHLRLPNDTLYVYTIPPSTSSQQPFLTEIRDAYGQRIALGYDSNVRLSSIVDAQGKVTTLTYNTQGLATQVTDPFGRAAHFEYDTAGNLRKITDMGGYWAGFTYDTNVYLTAISSERGTHNFWIEPADGLNNGPQAYPPPGGRMYEDYRITITDPLGYPCEYHYNGYSSYAWYVSPRDYVPWRSQFDNNFSSSVPKTTYYFAQMSSGRQGEVDRVEEPGGRSRRYNYNSVTGDRTSVVDSHGHTWKRNYNWMGRMTSTTEPKGNSATFTYSANGIDLVTFANSLGQAVLTRDAQHKVTSATDRLNRTTTFAYNSFGQLISLLDPLQVTTAFTYDANNHLSQVQRAGFTVQSYTHDSMGRIHTQTDANGQTHTYSYNDLNQVTRVDYSDGTHDTYSLSTCCPRLLSSFTDRAGRTTSFVYDALKRVVQRTNPEGGVTRFAYDPNGNLTQLVDPNGNTTTLAYNLNNQVIRKTYANGQVVSAGYDEAGLLVTRTNSRGVVITYTYDSNHDLTRTDYSDGTPSVINAYDAAHRLTQITDELGTSVNAYDAESRLLSVAGPWPNETITYGYDSLDRLTNAAVQLGQPVSYAYDALNRLTAVQTLLGNYTYNYSGASPIVRKLSRPNGSYTTNTYDSLNRLTLTSNRKVAGAVVNEFAYHYTTDGLIDIETISNGVAFTYPRNELAASIYNNLNQLLSTQPINQIFAYDADGNLIRGYTPSNYVFTAAYNAENHLLWLVYTNGSLVVCSNRYTYSIGGFLAQVREYRNGVLSNDTRYVRSGYLLVQERGAANTLTREYVWGQHRGGGIGGLLSLAQGGQFYSYFYDGKANVTALLDLGQSVAVAYRHDAFGIPLATSGSLNQPFRFSTKPYDPQTGLSDFGLRQYMPALGRWPNRDPIGELGGRNLYGFNYNNPIQFYDPDGRNPAVIVIGGVTVTVGQCAVLAVMTCLAIPPCRDALIKLVQEGVREIGDCCKPKKCPPCTPYAAGTTGHLGPHATSPSAPPEAPRPTHYNLFIVNQQAPPLCKCYWNRLPPHYSAIPGTVDLNNGFPALSP